MEGVIVVAAFALFVWLFIPKGDASYDEVMNYRSRDADGRYDFESAAEMMAYVKEERKKLGKEDEC